MGMVKIRIWTMSKQNPNPLTDYDKTLHLWFISRDKHVIHNFYKSAVRSFWSNTWNIRPFLFLVFFVFFEDAKCLISSNVSLLFLYCPKAENVFHKRPVPYSFWIAASWWRQLNDFESLCCHCLLIFTKRAQNVAHRAVVNSSMSATNEELIA